MKWTTRDLKAIERRLNELGVTVEALCRKADINRSTWTLWKGTPIRKYRPRPKSWDKVKRAFAEIESERNAA